MAAPPGLRRRPAHLAEDLISNCHCEERSDEAIPIGLRMLSGDCFAEFILGRRSAPTRGLAMTAFAALAQPEFGAGIALEPQPEFGADLDRVAHRALAAAAPLGLAVLRQ